MVVIITFFLPPHIGGSEGACGGIIQNLPREPKLWYCGFMRVTIDTDQIKQFESDLKTFASRAYPFATKNTINQAAFDAQRRYKENARGDMQLRNKFTESSIRVDQARTLNVGRQVSTVGSTAPYMDEQEFGATIRKRGKIGVPIPTTVASGEGEGVQPRTRVVPRSRRLGSIRLRNKGAKARSRKQVNFLKVQQTAKSSNKFVFLDLQKHPGIYRVSGGKRNPKVKLIHDMSKESVSIPRNQMLAPAVKATERIMPELYLKSLEFQLKRQGLFKG